MDEQEQPPVTASPTPVVEDAPSRIEQWFVERIQNSPASRDVQVYNHLRAVVDELKAKFAPPPAPGGEG